jgi:hypothetical protein
MGPACSNLGQVWLIRHRALSMTIVPVEIELGVSEAIAVSLMMIHGRIETHNHIKHNTQIKHNKRYIHILVDIELEIFFFLYIVYTVEYNFLRFFVRVAFYE